MTKRTKRITLYHELAYTVRQMVQQGINDPSTKEICTEYYEGRRLSAAILNDTRKNLPTIKRILRNEFDFDVCLLSWQYYCTYHRQIPATMEERKQCLTIGKGRTRDGLWISIHNDDPFLSLDIEQNLASGAGKYKSQVDRITDGVFDNRMTVDTAQVLMHNNIRRFAPKNSSLLNDIMKEPQKPQVPKQLN